MPQLLNMVAGLAAVVCVGGVVATKLIDRPRAATPAKEAVAQRESVARPVPSAAVQPPPSAPAPPPWASSGYGVVTIEPGPGGHYIADVDIQGRRLQMLVDTGASIIALTEEDARAVGIFPSYSDYAVPISTANGSIKAAPVMLREVRIRGISVRDVRAVVLPRGAAAGSLLGMSFLQKLRGFEVASGRLILRQ